MFEVDLLINNAEAKAAGGATFDRLNPMTGEVASRAAAAGVEDAKRAVDAAAAAFPAWSEMAPAGRRALLNKAADLLEAAGAKFAPMMGAETGSTAMWAGFNCMLASGMIREAAAMTTQISGEVIPSNVPGSLAMGYRQPVGVVRRHRAVERAGDPRRPRHRHAARLRQHGGAQGLRDVPRHASADRRHLPRGRLPAGRRQRRHQRAQGRGAVVEALIAHPAVRRVNFTGSSRVGKIIAKKCAEYLKPVLLELGGKSPLVMLDDADLDEAVNAAAFGAFANQGQICMSTERIVVDEKVADEFVQALRRQGQVAVGRRSARGQGDPGLGGRPQRGRSRHLAGARCRRQGRQAGGGRLASTAR